jgi:hypothetical protein
VGVTWGESVGVTWGESAEDHRDATSDIGFRDRIERWIRAVRRRLLVRKGKA